jgi:hypothetical protein
MNHPTGGNLRQSFSGGYAAAPFELGQGNTPLAEAASERCFTACRTTQMQAGFAREFNNHEKEKHYEA